MADLKVGTTYRYHTKRYYAYRFIITRTVSITTYR